MPEWVEATFDAGLGEYEGRVGEYIEVEPPERDARYATGADWAKEQDYTVIITWRMDVRPHRLVAFERRQREPWPVIVSRFDQRVERYGGKAQHDATGLGGVIDDYKQSKSDGVVMIGNRRRDLFSNYIAALEDGAFIAPKIQFMADEHLYATVNDLYGSGHPPDSIVAAALAYDAGGQKRIGGVVKTLAQRQAELRDSVILRYTGTRSFQLAIGGTMQNIRPGWYSRVERGLGEAIASQFPEHFVTSNR
jgi:phage FluMu gp28-like protein